MDQEVEDVLHRKWEEDTTLTKQHKDMDGGSTHVESWRFSVQGFTPQRFAGIISLHNHNLDIDTSFEMELDYPYHVFVQRYTNDGQLRTVPVFNCRSEDYARRYINQLCMILNAAED